MPSNKNVVQETSDYDKFRFMKANRDQNRGHVETLKRAFEEVGNLTRVQPILVNDKMEIIDGQHRFIASKELGLPIFYTQVTGLGVDVARSMNILHRNWTVEDYANSYAETGDKNYQEYVKLREDYGYSHSITIAYVHDTTSAGEMGNRSNIFKEFREGELKIDDLKGARDRLNKFTEIVENGGLRTRGFALAILKVMGSDNYNHKQMLSKLRQYGDRMLKRYDNIEDNLRLIEEIYNHNQTASKRVRLY